MKQTNQLIEEITTGIYKDIFNDLYMDVNVINIQPHRYIEAILKFEKKYGEGKVAIFSTPGRSEVCGNHTDHQRGKVLAAAVNLDTIAVVSYNNDNKIRLFSYGYDIIEIDIDDNKICEKEKGTSAALIKGTLYKLKSMGNIIGGFNAYITSDVMVGAGLSSSAAFEVMIGTIISGLFNEMKISSIDIAKAARYAENVYFGKPCGLMDQMACSVGGMISIDFKIQDEPAIISLDTDFCKFNYSLCIIDTKGSHEDLTNEYSSIPAEMKQVAEIFSKEVLVEVSKKEFYENISMIRNKLGDRAVLRGIHFYNEQENVKKAVQFLREDNIEGFLKTIKESGNSSYKYLQNVYSNKDILHQNLSVALGISENILGENGVCRVHGGGFAGTIQAFVKNEFVNEYKKNIDNIFGKDSCHILKVRKYGGIKVCE